MVKIELKSEESPVSTQSTPPAKKESYSALVIFIVCALYGTSSAMLTFVNKMIYAKFGFKSPLNLLML